MNLDPVDRQNSTSQSIGGSWRSSTNRLRKLASTHARGRSHSAQHYLNQEFDVEYCDRHVRRLLTEAGLSRQTARPQYTNADERAQEAFRDGFKKSSPIWTTSTRS